MTLAALCASHTPLKDYLSPGTAIEKEISDCFTGIGTWVDGFAPDLVVVLGPDHFNGFFYQLMPSFCVGAAVEAIGDWKTPAGAFPVDAAIAEGCVRALHQQGIDAALSHRMVVDHGVVQILDQLFDWEALPPILPIFINCAAPPLPPLARVVALGRTLGRYLASLERRVLIIGSGGLSHDPPIPRLIDAPEEVRRRLIDGGLSPAARTARQQRVLDEAVSQRDGSSQRTPLNPKWDQAFLDLLVTRNFEKICDMDDDSITRNGGCGGHEIRTWVAASAAIDVARAYHPRVHYYRAIPTWVAGFGVMTLESV